MNPSEPFLHLWGKREVAERSIQGALKQRVSPEVLRELDQQNSPLGLTLKQRANLTLLQRGECVAVFTGQQVSLFLGPLFTLYKAITAIEVAKQIRKEHGVSAVPIFWLQSEDHDFEEIRSCTTLTHDQKLLTLELPKRGDERVSVEHLRLPEEVCAAREHLLSVLPRTEHSAPLLNLIEKNYREGASLTNAFHALFHGIVGESGLLFFSLRKAPHLARRALRTSLHRRHEIERLLRERSSELDSVGLPSQVRVRPRSPLFFFHSIGAASARYRLEEVEPELFQTTPQERVSTAELERLIENEPERFSTSALLRPLVQDSLFPSAVYVGGAAEESYFRQLTPLRPLFLADDHRPSFALRAHITLIEPKAERLLSELHLAPEDLASDERDLFRRVLPESDPLSHQTSTSLDHLFSTLRHQIALIDPTLLSPLEKTEEKIRAHLSSLLERVERASHLKDSVTHSRIQALRTMLRPLGQPQERVLSPLFFLAKYGGFLSTISEEVARAVREPATGNAPQPPYRTVKL